MKTAFRIWFTAQLFNALIFAMTIHNLYEYSLAEALSILPGLTALPLIYCSLRISRGMLHTRPANRWITLLVCAPGIVGTVAVCAALAILFTATVLFDTMPQTWMLLLCLPSIAATIAALIVCRRHIYRFVHIHHS